MVELNETQLLMLSTCWQLMRAIPFEAPSRSGDPPWDFFEAVASFFCQVAEAVSNTFRSIVNAVSDTLQRVMEAIEGAMKVVREAVQRLMEMIEEGVRLVTAGLAAVAGFLGKLFSDVVEFFRELGQKVWGALQEFVEVITEAAKRLLYALAWLSVRFLEEVVTALKTFIESMTGLDLGSNIVKLRVQVDSDWLVLSISTTEYPCPSLGISLPSIVFSLCFMKYYDWFGWSWLNMTFIAPGIPRFPMDVMIDAYPVSFEGENVSEVLPSEVVEFLRRNPWAIVEMVNAYFSLACATGSSTALAYGITASLHLGPSAGVIAVSILAGVTHALSAQSCAEALKSLAEGGRIGSLLAFVTFLAIASTSIWLFYKVCKRVSRFRATYFVLDWVKRRPFRKLIPLFGSGFILGMISFVLKLMGVESINGVPLSTAFNAVVKMLISKKLLTPLIIRLLKEVDKRFYGAIVGKIFIIPFHLLDGYGTTIAIFYIVSLLFWHALVIAFDGWQVIVKFLEQEHSYITSGQRYHSALTLKRSIYDVSPGEDARRSESVLTKSYWIILRIALENTILKYELNKCSPNTIIAGERFVIVRDIRTAGV